MPFYAWSANRVRLTVRVKVRLTVRVKVRLTVRVKVRLTVRVKVRLNVSSYTLELTGRSLISPG